MSDYHTIKGLEGRDPIGAVLSCGKKSGRGFPTETDRFHFINTREESGIRHPHPAFMSFNTAQPDQRKVIRGSLVHSTVSECFEYHLKAQVLNTKHPDRRPACVGDGVHATRWEGGAADEFFKIKCPNELCEFRQTAPPKCKPFARLLFRVRWKAGSTLPGILVKYTTGSWNTVRNLKGYFEYIEKSAKSMGMEHYSLFGMPFTLKLNKETRGSKKTAFPVVTIASEMEDPITFFQHQADMISQIQAGQKPIALTDKSEQDADLVYSDVMQISHPRDM